MKNIKLRAFLRKRGEIGDVVSMNYETKTVCLRFKDEWNSGFYSFYDVDFMQTTNLLDKNDKEIFEGDVISVTGGFTYEITSQNCQLKCQNFGATLSIQQHMFDRYQAEVIGNVYENPELANKF